MSALRVRVLCVYTCVCVDVSHLCMYANVDSIDKEMLTAAAHFNQSICLTMTPALDLECRGSPRRS